MMYSRGIIDSIEDGIVRIEGVGQDEYVAITEFQAPIEEGMLVEYDQGWKVIGHQTRNQRRFERLKRKRQSAKANHE